MELSDALIEQRYKPLRRLGEGGQARTYLACDTRSGAEVVLKMLSVGRAADWKAIELFEREATVLKSLKHPAIPGYIDAFYRDEIGFCLVQEYLAGDSLQRSWEASGALFDDKRMRAFLAEILPIISYLQGFSPPIVHRDIKPSNILVSADSDWPFRLIDFGAVQRIAHGGVGGSTVVGTSGYMPPEQLMGRAQSATDLYALGATCVYLASGIEPSQLPVERMRLRFREYVDLSGRLASILEKMLEPDITERFATAEDVLDALNTPGSEPLPTSRGATPPKTLATREDALQERITYPPILAPQSRVQLVDGLLQIALPIHVNFPTARLFAGLGVALLGLWMAFLGNSLLALFGFLAPLFGVYFMASSFMKFSGAGRDELHISARGVSFKREKLSARHKKRPAPHTEVHMPLRTLNHCYLEGTSSEHGASRKKGIVFRDTAGRRVRFGGADVQLPASASQAGLGDAELSWLFEIIQAHLQQLNDPVQLRDESDSSVKKRP